MTGNDKPNAVGHLKDSFECDPVVDRHAHVFGAAGAAVVPEQPATVFRLEDHRRLVAGVTVPRAGFGFSIATSMETTHRFKNLPGQLLPMIRRSSLIILFDIQLRFLFF